MEYRMNDNRLIDLIVRRQQARADALVAHNRVIMGVSTIEVLNFRDRTEYRLVWYNDDGEPQSGDDWQLLESDVRIFTRMALKWGYFPDLVSYAILTDMKKGAQ